MAVDRCSPLKFYPSPSPRPCSWQQILYNSGCRKFLPIIVLSLNYCLDLVFLRGGDNIIALHKQAWYDQGKMTFNPSSFSISFTSCAKGFKSVASRMAVWQSFYMFSVMKTLIVLPTFSPFLCNLSSDVLVFCFAKLGIVMKI